MESKAMEAEAGQPHEALFLVLPYLPLNELLTTAEVCTSLRDAVREDTLLYLDLIVQYPLSRKLSDDILLNLTSKAGGRLRIMSLTDCFRITDHGLLRVIEENRLIEQLHLPGCTSLTPEGVVNAVKVLTSNSNNLKYLKINGIYNLDKEHIQNLKLYFDQNRWTRQELQEPAAIFFHSHANTTPLRDCRSVPSMDVEVCPKCDQVRMVFSCPKETCRECQGCIFCIPRCADCGVCVKASDETDEAVCGDLLCSVCWVRSTPKCRFCNRPYCRQHWKQETTLHTSGPDGFLCGVCDSDYIMDDAY